MIQVVLSINREILNFLIRDREIFYTDRHWKAWIRCLPPPKDFINKIRMSRNKIPTALADLFTFTEKEMEEYNAAKTEKELAAIVIRDSKLKGCKLISMEEKQEDKEEKKDDSG